MFPPSPITPHRPSLAPALVFIVAITLSVSAVAEALSDRDVALAVNERLYRDPAVSNLLIEVEVDQGVVLLSGSVTNLMAQERAHRLAGTVRGVRAIVDRIKVVPTFRPDSELEQAVTAALAAHPATEAYEIKATVERQRATLRGTVDSGAERRLAGRVAKGIAGLEAVANKLSVEPTGARSDRELEAEIEAMLAWDALVEHDGIEVEVVRGTVQLSGFVGSVAEKNRAAEQSWIAGVVAVDDTALQVSPAAADPRLRKRNYALLERPDPRVAEALRAALARDPRVPDRDIGVEVDEGTAILSGRVDSLFARHAAAETARNTLGVHRVVNRIRVRPPPLSDRALRQHVIAALDRHWALEHADIEVRVSDGVVALDGRVDSSHDKALADTAATGVRGVVALDNRLVVAGEDARRAQENGQ
jgi:osmotically-inducible protein OsmY